MTPPDISTNPVQLARLNLLRPIALRAYGLRK